MLLAQETAQETQETVWHFWLAVPLVAGAVLLVVAIVALYFWKVTRMRYPKEQG